MRENAGKFGSFAKVGVAVFAAAALVCAAGPAAADDDPQIARGLWAPEGFHEFPWAQVPVPTSLAWSKRGELYVTSLDGNVYTLRPEWDGQWGGTPKTFASGLSQPLGVVVAGDGKVYVSDSEKDSEGLAWGRVQVFEDRDGDGAAESRATVVEQLPNGRHNTNGLAFGPDGKLYVTNGNRTDDGIECGPPPTPVDCGNPGEDQPLSGSLVRIDPGARNQRASADMVVATGMRNVYDVAFWPGDPNVAYLPTNGPDDPAADDLLYRTRIDDTRAAPGGPGGPGEVTPPGQRPADPPAGAPGNRSAPREAGQAPASGGWGPASPGARTAPAKRRAPKCGAKTRSRRKAKRTRKGKRARTARSRKRARSKKKACSKARSRKARIASAGGSAAEQRTADAPQTAPSRAARAGRAEVVDDMGFPSCLYNAHTNSGAGEVGGHHGHGAGLEPMDNPNPAVIERFGKCKADSVTRPVATFGGHVSADGLAFAHGSGFPGSYRNDLFVAEWGNLWGAEDGHLVGHKIIRVNLRDDGSIVRDHHGMPWTSEFATAAAPIDVAFGPDGAMYVADNAGFIHKIAWTGADAPPADEEDQAPPPADDGHDHGGGGGHDDSGECPPGTTHGHDHETGRTECTAFKIGDERGTWEPATQDDNPEASPGDRGWAWRWQNDAKEGGGHTHNPGGFDPGCSDGAVNELVTRLRNRLTIYDNDPWRASVDGFWMYPIAWKTYHMMDSQDDPAVAVPEHVESFIYAMTDQGLQAMGGMFTLPKEYKDLPVERLPGFRASNGETCKLPWHNHTDEEGLVTSFDPQNPTQSNWMAHVWFRGYDVWEQQVDGSEPSGWWAPYRSIPTFCNDQPACL